MESRETPAAFARRLGVNKSTVCRAIQSGRLILVDGLLEVASSMHRWKNTKTGQRPDVAARHAANRRAGNPEATPKDIAPPAAAEAAELPLTTPDDGADSGPPSLATHTQELLAAQNAMARLSIQLRTHKRYPLESISREAQALGATLRSALERLVDQTAPRLAVQHDPDARRATLAGEVARLQRLLRREMPRALRRLRSEGKNA